MQLYSTTDIIKTLQKQEITLFTLSDFAKLFDLENQQTLYKKIARLEKTQLIEKLVNGKYRFLLRPGNDFQTANFLYFPSYISLDSALSFHSIATGFPYQLTSVTIKPTKSILVKNQEFKYSHFSPDLFWGYEKKENFLIAEPEKAILDYIYLGTKGLRQLSFDEMDLSALDKAKLVLYSQKFHNHQVTEILERLL